jgi:hypothetical protein
MTQEQVKNGQLATTRPTAQSAKSKAVKVADMEQVIEATVKKTLMELGLDTDNPIELQRDFAHLRTWRESIEEVKRKGFLAAVTVVVTGALGLFWVAFKGSLH